MKTFGQVKAAFSVSATSGCNSLQAFFSDNSTGSPTSWFWDFGNGQTSVVQNPAVLYETPGVFTVSLTVIGKNSNDKLVKTDYITVNAGPKALFSYSPTGGCTPVDVIFQDSSNAMEGFITNWNWDFGDGATSTDENPFHIYTTDGVFPVSLSVTNSKGCSDTLVNTNGVSAGAKPKASFYTNQLDVCASVPISFYNRTTGAITSYFWTFGDGDTTSRKAPQHYYIDTGYMNVTLYAFNNACYDSLELKNYVHIKPPIVKISSSFVCDSPYKRNFQGKYLGQKSILWNFGDGTTSTQATPQHTYQNTGVYTVSLHAEADFCSYDDTITVQIIDEKPVYSFSSSDTLVCKYDPIKFKAEVPHPAYISLYTWDYGDGTISVPGTSNTTTYVYNRSGTFYPSLIVTDIQGCKDTVVNGRGIDVHGPVAAFAPEDSITCINYKVNFSDYSLGDGKSAINTWIWDYGDGTIDTLTGPPFIHVYNTIDSFSVKLKIKDGNGCIDSLTKINGLIAISPPIAAFSAIDTLSCLFTSVSFFDESEGQILGRRWYFGDGDTSTQVFLEHLYAQPGLYPVKIIIGKHKECSDTATLLVHILPLPNVYAGQDTVLCYGQAFTLQPKGADTYTWTPNVSLSCYNCTFPFAQPFNSTWYYVTGTDKYGCKATDSLYAEVKQKIRLSLLKVRDTVCIGNSVQLFASGAELYQWQPPSTLNNANIPNPVASPSETTYYTLKGTDSKNCFLDSIIVTVQVLNNPQFNIIDTNITLSAGSYYVIKTTSSPDVVRWQWQPPEALSCTDCAEPNALIDKLIDYTGTAFNAFGCNVSDRIRVQGLCNNEVVFIPNTFSPNGDNINDWFYPRGKGIYRIKSMHIFNRLGQTVFQKLNFQPDVPNQGWNGKAKSVKLPSDVYIYYMEIICNNGTTITFKGNITLLL